MSALKSSRHSQLTRDKARQSHVRYVPTAPNVRRAAPPAFEPSGPLNAAIATALDSWVSMHYSTARAAAPVMISALVTQFAASEIGKSVVSAALVTADRLKTLAENYFNTIDIDGDGCITREEVSKVSKVSDASAVDRYRPIDAAAAKAAVKAEANKMAIATLKETLETDMSIVIKTWFPPTYLDPTNAYDQEEFKKVWSDSLKKGMKEMFTSDLPKTFRITLAVKCIVEGMLQDRTFIDALGNEKTLEIVVNEAISRTLAGSGLMKEEVDSVRRAVAITVKDPESMSMAKRFFTATGADVDKKQLKDAIRFAADGAMRYEVDSFATAQEQATVWLSTQTNNIVEGMKLGGTFDKLMADLKGSSTALKPTQELLGRWLETIDPQCKNPYISQLRLGIAAESNDLITTLMYHAAQMHILYNDEKTLAVLKEAQKTANDARGDQINAYLAEIYSSWLLNSSFVALAAAAAATITTGLGLMVCLLRYRRMVFGLSPRRQQEYKGNNQDFAPFSNGVFRSYIREGKKKTKFWAQEYGTRLRKCKNVGHEWAGSRENRIFIKEKLRHEWIRDTPNWVLNKK